MQTGHFQANGRLKHEAFANTGQGRHIAQSSIPEDLSVAFKVLCNAARADKTRLQQLEVEVARFSHRAETAESEKLELQAQLQQLQVSYNAARADNTRLQQLEVEVARYSHRADAAESAKLELQAQLQQLQVSYNAARADKARLQQLEVEVARFSRRAETAESEKLELHASLQQLQGAWEQQAEMIDRLKALKSALALKDAELTERLQQQAHHHAQELAQWQHKLKSALSLKDAELTERLQQQSDRHANELAQLQHKLSQTSMELMAVQQQVANLRQQQQHELSSVRQQHTQEMCMLQQQHTQEVSRLQQQLEEAAQKARSTEASSVHVREALSFHTRMGQQLPCLLTLTNNSSSHTHSTSLPASPLANRSSYGLSASLPASPFAASCPVTPLPPVQYTQPNLRSCSSVEPAASPPSRSALSGFHSGISISATRDSPAHSYEWDSRNGTNTQLSEGQHPHSPAHSSSMPEDRAAAAAVVAAAAAAAQPGWHSHAVSSAAAGSSSSLTPMRSTRCVSPRSSPNSPLRSAETPVAEPTVSFTPIRSSGCVSPRSSPSSPSRSMETPTTSTHEVEAAVAAAVAAAQSNWHSHGIRGGAAEGLPSLTHMRSTGCVSPRSNPGSPLRSIETPAATTQASAAAAAVSGDPAQDGSAAFKLPLLSREYARLAVSSKAESAAAAAAAAKLASQLYSVSSTRPLVSGEYVPLGGGGTAGPPDEQMASQLFSGPALMPFSKAAPGQPSHRAAAAVAQRPAAAERQKWKAAAGKTAPQQQQTGLGVRAASGSGRKQWNQQTATAGYAAKVQPAALSGEVKEGAAVGQQQQQQVRQQEHEQQRQILMAAAQLAAQWVEQRGAYSQAAGSVRSGSRHATPAQQARTKYEQLLQKATERVDQQLQKEKQRQLHQQEKKQQKDRGPGMLMFRWSRDSTPRRFSSTGASVDPGPAESHAAPSSGGSSRHASEVAVEPSARVFSPRSSRRVSTASNCSEKQAAGTGQGRNQSRRRADDGTAASAPSYTHFSFKQHKKRTQYQCLRSAQVKQQHQ